MKRFRRILCAVNTEQPSASALARAAELAETHQADLTVADIAEPLALEPVSESGTAVATLQQCLSDERAQRLHALVEPYRGRLAIHTELLTGTPFLEIVRSVLRGGHDIVIRAAEQPGWLGRLLGSDDMHLLRKCPCPVWMVRTHEPARYRRIVAAVDVGYAYPQGELETRHALNLETLDIAASLAVSHFAELHVVHVWDAIGESAMRGAFVSEPEHKIAAYVEEVHRRHAGRLDALMREMAQRFSADAVNFLNPQLHLMKGYPRKDIAELAKRIEADVIVMGTVARTGIPGLIMGNTAETVLSQLDCSVLAIKPPGFVSPIALEK